MRQLDYSGVVLHDAPIALIVLPGSFYYGSEKNLSRTSRLLLKPYFKVDEKSFLEHNFGSLMAATSVTEPSAFPNLAA